jgi:hypothetical protein
MYRLSLRVKQYKKFREKGWQYSFGVLIVNENRELNFLSNTLGQNNEKKKFCKEKLKRREQEKRIKKAKYKVYI